MKKSRLSAITLVSVLAMTFGVSGSHAEEQQILGGVVVGKNADRFEVDLGALSYDTGLFTSKLYDGVVINGEVLFPSPDFLSFLGAPRPHIGANFAAVDDPIHFVYAGLTWDAYLTERVYLTGSVGGGFTTADNLDDRSDGYKALGCRALFHLGAGLGFDMTRHATIQLYADHFSNANFCSPNNGAETAGIRFGYRF